VAPSVARSGTLGDHQRTLHELTLLDHHTACVLGQMPVDVDSRYANATWRVLTEPVVKVRDIVADEVFRLRDVCRPILNSGGESPAIVDDNRPALKREVHNALTEPNSVFLRRSEKSSGRPPDRPHA